MDALSSLCYSASESPLYSYPSDDQLVVAPEMVSVPNPRTNLNEPLLPTSFSNASESISIGHVSSCALKQGKESLNPVQAMPSPDSTRTTGKRKRMKIDDELKRFHAPTPTKRKASNDYLRKGQWTSTEERLARLLIEAFEEGYLPIYTGIRLRGYLAVQLQCDPMRVSKKLCAGTIDGKTMPKNYGQKKFKLRKKHLWDSDDASCRISELESLTRAMWTEARMRKPSYLTLSSTRNMNVQRGAEDESDSGSSPPRSVTSSSLSSTPRSKKHKMFPIIYLNLSKLKHYSGRTDHRDGDPVSPSKESDSDDEPVRLDGESLQAAYDLLTLCSPRGAALKGKAKKSTAKRNAANFVTSAEGIAEIKSVCDDFYVDGREDKLLAGNSTVVESCECPSSEYQWTEDSVKGDDLRTDACSEGEHVTAIPIAEVSKVDAFTVDTRMDNSFMEGISNMANQ